MAKYTIPANKIASSKPIATNVFEAFFGAGSLKFGIAFDMASTPVKAELPDEKALSNKNKEIPATGVPLSENAVQMRHSRL